MQMRRALCIWSAGSVPPASANLQLVPFDPRTDAVDEEFLARGDLMQAEESFYFDINDVGSFIVNIADVQQVKLTSDITRLYGCCGPGGGHGPNLRCEVCDSYVATKVVDCCTPHFIVFDPTATQAVQG